MNHVWLIGRLVRDPEISYTEKGTARGRIWLAVERGFQSADGQDADFIPVTLWQKQAEATEKYLAKGARVAVEGRIQTRRVSKNGKATAYFEVVARRIKFLDSPRKEEEPPSEEEATAEEELSF